MATSPLYQFESSMWDCRSSSKSVTSTTTVIFVAIPATSHRKDSRRSSARRDSHLSSYDTTAVDGFNESGNGVHRRRGEFI